MLEQTHEQAHPVQEEYTLGTMRQLNLVNDDAEMNVLSAIFKGNIEDAQVIADNLDYSDFYDRKRQLLYLSGINVLNDVNLMNRGVVLAEALRLREVLKVDASRDELEEKIINALPQRPADGLEQAQLVKKMSQCRQLAKFSMEMQKRLQLNPDVTELHAWASGELQAHRPTTADEGWVYAWETVSQHEEIIKQQIAKTEAGISLELDWPWQAWNRYILPPEGGTVGIIGAPDGAGKSTLLSQIAEHWSKKCHVALVHLEDSKRKKWNRRMTRYSGIPYGDLRAGRLTAEQMRLKTDTQNYIHRSHLGQRLHYYHTPGSSMRGILNMLQEKISEGNCDVVVLDYLDKIMPDSRQAKLFGSDVNERQGDDMEMLKIFAEQNDIHVLCAKQGNQNIIDAPVMTRKNLMGSYKVSQKAQLVVMMRRKKLDDDMHDPHTFEVIAEANEDSPVVEFRIDKQNDGGVGEFKLWFTGEKFTFSDYEG